jgi:hypothetical protein
VYVVVHQDGTRWLRQATPLCVDTLQHMFEWIESADPRVQQRLRPDTFRDPKEEAAWRRLMDAELSHLVATRRELVEKDLKKLKADGPGLFRFPIGRHHQQAWLSALNAARLALFELHGLGPEHMDGEPEDVDGDERQLALVRIHVMGFMQELILHRGGGEERAAEA